MRSEIVIEPLGVNKHDRAAFGSGVEQVDNFLKKTAGKLMKGGTARIFVATSPNDNPEEILGFYSINAHSVDYGDLHNRYRRYALPDGKVPAAFIGMMGVTSSAQSQGLGGLLLADALKGAYIASYRVGTAMVLLDVLDCGNSADVARRQTLYNSFGFQCLPSHPLRMFLPVATIAQMYKEP